MSSTEPNITEMVDEILNCLTDRKGIRQAFDAIDDCLIKEIKDELYYIVRRHL